MAYDHHGNLICTRDPNHNMTTITYDASGLFASATTNSLGHRTMTTYYGVDGEAMKHGLYGQVKSVIAPNQATTVTQYDPLGRQTLVTHPAGFWTLTRYKHLGTVGRQHVHTNSKLGLSTWTYFDGQGRLTTQKKTGTDGKRIVSKTQYDPRGAVTRTSTPYFEKTGSSRWTKMRYDALGRILHTKKAQGGRTFSCYDDEITVTIDANGHRTRTIYDAAGRTIAMQEYTGTFTQCDTHEHAPYSTTSYQYNTVGNLLSVTDALSNRQTMHYDTLSRLVTRHDPDLGTWTFTYDANGNVLTQTDANAQTLSFQYDALNRLVQKHYETEHPQELDSVHWSYDGNTPYGRGRLSRLTDTSGETTYDYDSRGRVTQTTRNIDGQTYTTQMTYDGIGRLTDLTYPDGHTVRQTYNGPSLAALTDDQTPYGRYSDFTALGQSRTLTYGNGVTTTSRYSRKTTRLKKLKTVSNGTVLQHLRYRFDATGNVTQLKDKIHGTQRLTYDALDRLTQVEGSAYPTPLTYIYDQIGNIRVNSQVGSYTYSPSGPQSVRPRAVTAAGPHTYAYDHNGNMTSGADRTLTYDPNNLPVTISKDGATTTMMYDGAGNRVKKFVDHGTHVTATTYIGKYYVCQGTEPISANLFYPYSK